MSGPLEKRRWHEWQAENQAFFNFRAGERVFEYTDNFSPTGWKVYDRIAQEQLRRIFVDLMESGESNQEDVDCLGWKYTVKFDVFHRDASTFANAPQHAIGYQVANHEKSTSTTRWIRLSTQAGH